MGNLHTLSQNNSQSPRFLLASQQIALHMSEILLAQMSADVLVAKKMTVYKVISGNDLFIISLSE